MELTKILNKVLKPSFQVVKTASNYEIQSSYFNHLITLVSFFQLCSTCIKAFDIQNLDPDLLLLRVIDWSDYANLIAYYLTTKTLQLYLVIGIQAFSIIQFGVMTYLCARGKTQDSAYKFLLRIQGLHQQLHAPILLVPAMDTFMYFLINAQDSKAQAIISGIFLFWPILFAGLVEARFGMKTRFYTERGHNKDLSLGCNFIILSKILLPTLHQVSVLYDSYMVSYIANGVCAPLVLIAYFKEMNFRTHSGANVHLAGISCWICGLVFVALKQYYELSDVIYSVFIIYVILTCALITLNKRISESLLLRYDFSTLSIGRLEFITKKVYAQFKRADMGDPIAQHTVIVFLKHFVQSWYRKNHDFIQSKELDSFQGFEDESRTSRKHQFKAKLKELLMVVLDLMYRIKISKSLNKDQFHLIVNYVLLSIHNEKNFLKAYRILLDYTEKKEKVGVNPYRRFILESIEEDVKQVLKLKFTSEALRPVTFRDAITFDELFADIKKELLDNVEKHVEIYNVLLERPLDLDKILKHGLKLVKQKKKLEAGLAKLFQLNPYHAGSFFLYRTYVNLDVVVDRIPNFTLMERKFIEFNSKGSQLSTSQKGKDINVIAKDTCVIYLSLSEKKLGKIIKHTSSMASMFGYSEEEAKYLRMESLQPVCIAEIHNNMLMNHIEACGKKQDLMAIPAVTSDQFLLPLKLTVKIEEIDRELCVAGFISKTHFSGNRLVLDKWGQLLNYTANFHSRIGLADYKGRKPLYGYNLATFVPKLVESLFPNVTESLQQDTESEAESPSQRQRKNLIGEMISDYFFVPRFPDRIEEMEKIFSESSKEYNPLITSSKKPEDELFYVERFLAMAEAIMVESSKKNMRLYRIDLKVNSFSKKYNETTHLRYYYVEVHELRLIDNPSQIDTEILRYNNLLSNIRDKLTSYSLRKGLSGRKTLYGSQKLLKTLNSENPALQATSLGGTVKQEEHVEKTPKIMVSEADRQSTRRRASNTPMERSQYYDEGPSDRRLSIFQADADVGESATSNADSQDENLKEETLQKSLSKLMKSLGQSHAKNGVYHKKKIVSFLNMEAQEQLDFEHESLDEEYKIEGVYNNNSEYNTEKMVEAFQSSRRSRNTQDDPTDSKKLFKGARDSLLHGALSQSPRKTYESKGSIKAKGSVANSKSAKLTIPSNQNTGGDMSPRNDGFLSASQNRISTNLFLSNNAIADSLGIGNKAGDIWAMDFHENEKDRSKSSDLKHNEPDQAIRRIARPQESQQTSSRTGLLQQISLLHRMIFDTRTPTYISRLQIFGIAAFGVFGILSTILFILLLQFFGSYTQFIEIADFTCPFNTAMSFFVIEQEKILFQNEGIFDPAFITSNETYEYALKTMQTSINVFRNKYESVVEITDIEATSQNFKYSAFDQTIYLPQPDGSTLPMNVTMTGAVVHMMDMMFELTRADFTTITTLSLPVIFFRENYNEYFSFFAQVTQNLFQDLYGTNSSVDIQQFSTISLCINLIVLFMFIAVLYPLFRKNESNQIRALSLFGTFTPAILEKRIEGFKYFYNVISNYRDEKEVRASQRSTFMKGKLGDGSKGNNSTRRTMGWRKRRVSIFVFLVVLAVIYGAMASYFVTDALRISSQNAEFLRLIEEYDLSTDMYSFTAGLYAITYQTMALFRHRDNETYISEVLDSFAYASTRITERKTDIVDHMINLETFLDEAMTAPGFRQFMLKLRGTDLCELVIGQRNITEDEAEYCQSLAEGVGRHGLTEVVQAVWGQMSIFNQTLTNGLYSRATTEQIVNTQKFLEYDRFLKFINAALSYWGDAQHVNLQDALMQQRSDSITSFCMGIMMLVLAYSTVWRGFIWYMQKEYLQAKTIYSVIPADMLLSNNYIKKFLRDNSKVAL